MGRETNMVEISSEICFSWIVAGFYTFRNSTAYLAFMDSISIQVVLVSHLAAVAILDAYAIAAILLFDKSKFV